MEFLSTVKRIYLYLFLFVCAAVLYGNTAYNEYAFDDDIIVSGNRPVQMGFAGIKEIFSTDMFASYFADNQAQNKQLSGGRYRPLSIATFAIEQQFVGFNPMPKHIVNVVLYGILIMLIFSFVLNDLKLNLPIAFITALLFALHPIHTEVVANIKSRDEILSLIFYLLTISFFLKHLDLKTKKPLLQSLLCFVAALLSKEYAITLLAVLPLTAYILRQQSISESLKNSTLFFIIFIGYTLVRVHIVGWTAPEQLEPLNNPYVYASTVEKVATKTEILLRYFILLVKPFPLSSDYSFAQIAYKTFANWTVWASIILHCTLLFFTVKYILQKKLWGWIGVIYFSNLFLVSNLVFNIGASMGERFLFHSSFAFCLAVAIGWDELKNKLSPNTFNLLTNSLVAVIAVCSFLIIIPRNRDWKNTHTLFLKDVITSPNSALCNANATVALVNMAMESADIAKRNELLNKAKEYSKQAIHIHPRYANAYMNWAVCDFNLNNYDSALVSWNKAFEIFPSVPHKERYAALVYNRALDEGKNKHFETAIKLLEWSTRTNPNNAACWSDLGGAYFSMNRLQDAKACWEKALSINPNDEQANRALPFVKMKLENNTTVN